jgi:hypothetical protein
VWVAGKIVAAGAWSDTLPLMVGDNSIAIRLVAENGDSGNYSVQVHRRNANADLVALTVNRGTLVPAFRPSDTAYTDTLLADSLTVNATADPSARLVQVVLDSPRVAGTPPMTFAMREGGQRVNVLVTAEEGNTRSYSIRVHRISRDTNLAGLAVSPGGLFRDRGECRVPIGVQGYPVACAGQGMVGRDSGIGRQLFGKAGFAGGQQRVPLESGSRKRG